MDQSKKTPPPGHLWVAEADYKEPIGGGESLLRTDVIWCAACGVKSFWCAHDQKYYVDVDGDTYRDVLPSCAEECAGARPVQDERGLVLRQALAALADAIAAHGAGDIDDLGDAADDAVNAVVTAAATAIGDGVLAASVIAHRDDASLVLDSCGFIHVAHGREIVLTEEHAIDGPSPGALLVAGHVWSRGEIAAGLVTRLKSGAQEVN